MSENSVSARAAAWPASWRASGVPRTWATPSFRRRLQLGLAAIWLLDAVLQLQSFMFGKGFSQMLAGMAAGNPGFIADPITWSARLVADHPTWANAAFASVQLFLAVGIAWRHAVKVPLAPSIPWAPRVCWAGARRLDYLGRGGRVGRVRTRRRDRRNGEPGDGRARRCDHLRASRRAAVAHRPRRAVRGGPPVRRHSGAPALADPVGQPGLVRH